MTIVYSFTRDTQFDLTSYQPELNILNTDVETTKKAYYTKVTVALHSPSVLGLHFLNQRFHV